MSIMPDKLASRLASTLPGRQPGWLEIDIQPVGRRVALRPGSTLLEAVQQAGIDLPVACGGMGICGTCRVRVGDVAEGDLSPPSAEEIEYLTARERLEGYRLACQAVPRQALRVEIPPESLPRSLQLQVEGGGRQAAVLDPWIKPLEVQLPIPQANENRTAYERLSDFLTAEGHPPLSAGPASREQLERYLHVEPRQPSESRTGSLAARLAVHAAQGELLLAGVLPAGAALLGMAVDLGTTKVAVYLVDLETGGILAQEGFMNPQIAIGEDVVSRIAFANRDPASRRLLQSRLVEALNASLERLCRACGCETDQVVDAVVVGNTVMHHLLCGLPVAQLGAAPYVPATDQPLRMAARELGLNLSPGASLYLPAIIAGYVGADHTAVLVSSLAPAGEEASPRRQVLVDIGTNTEITLVVPCRTSSATVQPDLYSCSCASGPAFEGAHIRHGMRAVQGAIDRVRIREGEVEVHTIGGEAPVGMCGTGILEAVAELLTSGAVDSRGVLRPGTPNLRGSGRSAEYVLVPADASGHGQEITISRQDIHEIQLAKAAIRAGIEILLAEVNLSPLDIDRWTIAGAFGTYLDVKRALEIGMFPEVPVERFQQVGNAAGAGAREMLLSQGEQQRAADLVRKVHYIELTTHLGFTQAFVEAMSFE
jgi:uncharacterized 2Fe-2S/4Fe-4S cluster protein (DUF4445 family)